MKKVTTSQKVNLRNSGILSVCEGTRYFKHFIDFSQNLIKPKKHSRYLWDSDILISTHETVIVREKVRREDNMRRRILIIILTGLFIGLAGVPPSYTQAPVAGEGPPPVRLSEKQLEDLVSRIALYPDDLLAIVLPASTFPLDIVQADRFLQQLKKNSSAPPGSALGSEHPLPAQLPRGRYHDESGP